METLIERIKKEKKDEIRRVAMDCCAEPTEN